jgi:hypothetical protein
MLHLAPAQQLLMHKTAAHVYLLVWTCCLLHLEDNGQVSSQTCCCLPALTHCAWFALAAVPVDKQWSVKPAASRFLLENALPGNHEK